MSSSKLAAVVLVLPLLAACSSSAEDDTSAGGQAASAAAPITLSNWESHPKIVEVTKLVAELDKARDGKVLVTKKTPTDLCVGFGEKTRSWSIDVKADDYRIVRFDGDLGDVKTIRNVYYDPSRSNAPDAEPFWSRVRYVDDLQNAVVRGGSREERAFFGADGALIWEVSRETSAAGVVGPWAVVAPKARLAKQSEFPFYDEKAAPACITTDEATRRVRDAGLAR